MRPKTVYSSKKDKKLKRKKLRVKFKVTATRPHFCSSCEL